MTSERALVYCPWEGVSPTWMSAIIQTLMVATLFLAIAASGVVGSGAGSEWVYTETKTSEGLSFDVAALAYQKPIHRSVLTFSFLPKSQCGSTVGLASFAYGSTYGKFLSSGTAPEEWAVQVDDHAPEQGRAVVESYSNSWEVILPVSRALVSDAKAGGVLRMWQTATGKYPPPPERRAHVELSLRGAATPLERAEASCAAALRR